MEMLFLKVWLDQNQIIINLIIGFLVNYSRIMYLDQMSILESTEVLNHLELMEGICTFLINLFGELFFPKFVNKQISVFCFSHIKNMIPMLVSKTIYVKRNSFIIVVVDPF